VAIPAVHGYSSRWVAIPAVGGYTSQLVSILLNDQVAIPARWLFQPWMAVKPLDGYSSHVWLSQPLLSSSMEKKHQGDRSE
jgi:hypothetical protein